MHYLNHRVTGVDDSLTRPRAVDREFREFWDEMEGILDIVLEKFESRYLVPV